jgi:hypothetical protein
LSASGVLQARKTPESVPGSAPEQGEECEGVVEGVGRRLVSLLMKEYQVVIQRISRHARADEDALTDLLNERSRSGWEPALLTQFGDRLTVVFQRATAEEP